ncbi:MAG: molybdopterin-guanine dinucleotide biosynthesis protein B [Candidatus Thiodiazotropha sp.]
MVIDFPRPLLGFSAYSGTGKTTLLKQLLPILREQGLRVAVIKHAHHSFDVDQPGKDSHELRMAGASPMLIASRRRMAMIVEFDPRDDEPTLEELLPNLDPHSIDLVLVEGFKQADFAKIELHRPSLGKPLLCTGDPRIIALASDADIPEAPATLPRLDINDPHGIAAFILRQIVAI